MYISLVLYVFVLLLGGCVSALPQTSANPRAQSLLGKSQADILQCAGKPVKQTSHKEGVIFRYYKEASMFEESRPVLKGSQPGIHHGCWAGLLIENGQVTGVEFRTVPEGAEKEDDECEEIFQQCLP